MSALKCDLGGCWYRVKGDDGQVRCGEPATHRYPTAAGWFQVCELHARVANEQNKGICITKIQVDDFAGGTRYGDQPVAPVEIPGGTLLKLNLELLRSFLTK